MYKMVSRYNKETGKFENVKIDCSENEIKQFEEDKKDCEKMVNVSKRKKYMPSNDDILHAMLKKELTGDDSELKEIYKKIEHVNDVYPLPQEVRS